MNGSNNSRIGMKNTHKGFDDDNWGYGKKDGRGGKGKNSKRENINKSRRVNNKRDYYVDE